MQVQGAGELGRDGFLAAAHRCSRPLTAASNQDLIVPHRCIPAAAQMSYATGRGGRAASPVRAAGAPPPAAEPTAASWPGTPTQLPPQEADTAELPPPPQPPIVLPSTAAAVRVKEQVLQPPLAVRSGYVPEEGAAAGEASHRVGEEEDPADAASDVAWLGDGQQADEQAPGLLAKAAEVAGTVAATVTNAAAAAVEAAAPVVRSVVGQGAEVAASGFDAAKGTAEAVAEAVQEDEEEAATQDASAPEAAGQTPATPVPQQRGAMVPGQRPVLPSPPAPAAGASHAAVTTAAVLPASASSPASTGKGYFPTVGAAVAVPKPAPRPSGGRVSVQQTGLGLQVPRLAGPDAGLSFPSLPTRVRDDAGRSLWHALTTAPSCAHPCPAPGDLEARKVVAERLTDLAEEAALRTPRRSAGTGVGAAGRAAGTGMVSTLQHFVGLACGMPQPLVRVPVAC